MASQASVRLTSSSCLSCHPGPTSSGRSLHQWDWWLSSQGPSRASHGTLVMGGALANRWYALAETHRYLTATKGRPPCKLDPSPRPHQPEPPAFWHTHGHSELVVCNVQHSLTLTQHQGTATITMWAEAGIGVAWQGSKHKSQAPTSTTLAAWLPYPGYRAQLEM